MAPTNDQIREVIGGDIPDQTLGRLRAVCGLPSSPCSAASEMSRLREFLISSMRYLNRDLLYAKTELELESKMGELDAIQGIYMEFFQQNCQDNPSAGSE